MARDSDSGRSPFLDDVRRTLWVRHYSIRTEEAYILWIKRFIRYHGLRHPEQMGEREVAAFLTHLAVDEGVAAGTQNQALNALVFLYKAVLDRPLGEIVDTVRAKRPERLPVVLTQDEVRAVCAACPGSWPACCTAPGCA